MPIDPGDPRWDALVAEHPNASVYHLSAWARILRDAYGYEPRYLALEDADGGMRGGLPMMEMRGALGGRRLRSMPVIPAGRALTRSNDDTARLLAGACELAEERSAKALTILGRDAGLEAIEPRLVEVPKTPTWILRLPDDPGQLRARWRKRSINLHRSIERALNADLRVREGAAEDDLRAFYSLYLMTMRRHNVLPRSLRQLALARDLLPTGVFRLVIVELGGTPIAGGVFHDFNGTVDLLYSASDSRHLGVRPNHALYWHVIERAIEHGRLAFDFGRARPHTPLARFKSQWGAEPVAEHRYELRGERARARADRRRDAIERLAVAHERRRLVKRAWDRTPLALTRLAGEIAYRWL
ncbi:MAG: lipid II:glycine glycyltransferase FemX [Solirubrobacterales bacterium]